MTSRMMIPDDQEPIAIIGTACRFSGQVSSLPTLWDQISNVKTGHCKVPSSRWDADLLHHPDPDRKGTMAVKHGYFLQEDISHFDAPFFSTTAKEAAAMDPMKRLLLEVSYESIENAGIQMENLVNSDTACYVGCMTNDYEILSTHDMQDMGYSAATGISKAMTANRVSWFFGLRGPSLTLDTACSSSLYALHLACQALKLGETSQALVAGVNMMLHPNCMEQFSAIHMLSPEGISHSFDDRANGYGRGEGIGCIVVKRLSDALRDGDTIRAVIRGSGVNADGKTPSLTQPSTEAQATLIRRTYASAGLSLSSTEYFECHGTGTPVGDPIELRALATTIGGARAAAGLGPLYIGSVKPNVGHTEGCSGLASIFKAILCLEKGMLVPTYDVQNVSPKLLLSDWHLALPTETIKWPSSGRRRISVNSFGFGGANAHIILDDAYHYLNERNLTGNHNTTVHDDDRSSESGISMGPSTPMSSLSSSSVLGSGAASYRLFTFSARDQAGTQRMAKEYGKALGSAKFKTMSGKELDDLAYTLAVRRTAHDYRSVIAASSVDELCAKLDRPVPKPSRASRRDRNLIFVFTGQGAQWPTMGIQLLRHPVFENSVRASQEYLAAHGCPWDAVEELKKTAEEKSQILLPEFSQTLCSVLQVALVDLLRHWNVKARATIGHSSGEIAAAYAAGYISHSDAIKIAYVRGISSAAVTKEGAMMAAGTSREEAQAYLDKLPSTTSASVACVNSPSSVTLSGDVEAIDLLEKMISEDNKFARKLKVKTAYHSAHMQEVSTTYHERMGEITPITEREHSDSDNETVMFSSLTGKLVDPQELTAQYWVANMCAPVEFAAAFAALLSHTEPQQQQQSASLKTKPIRWGGLVEVGPHSALQGPVQQNIAAASNQSAKEAPYVAPVLRGKNAGETALSAAGELWKAGFEVDLAAVNRTPSPSSLFSIPKVLTELPTYAWNHARGFWHESLADKFARFPVAARTDLLGVPEELQDKSAPRWKNYLRNAENPWMEQHKITGTTLYPGAGMLIMALEAATQMAQATARKVHGFTFSDVSFERGLVVTDDDDATVHTRLSLVPIKDAASAGQFNFTVSSTTNGVAWTQHCHGSIAIEYDDEFNKRSDIDDDKSANSLLWTRQTQDYDAIRQDETATDVEIDDFYEHLESKGMEYGELFRNVVSLTSVPGKLAVHGSVVIPDTASVMPANFEYPHTIHPATMDAIFHLLLATVNDGAVTEEAAVPYHLDSMFVAAQQPTGAGTTFKGYSNLTRKSHGGRQVIGDLVVSDEAWSAPKIQVKGFALRQVTFSDASGGNPADGEALEKKCAVLKWNRDADFAEASDAKTWLEHRKHKRALDSVLLVLNDGFESFQDVLAEIDNHQGIRPGYGQVVGLAVTPSSLENAREFVSDEISLTLWDGKSVPEVSTSSLIVVLGASNTLQLSSLQSLVNDDGHLLLCSDENTLAKEDLSDLQPSAINSTSIVLSKTKTEVKEKPSTVYVLLPPTPSASLSDLSCSIEGSLADLGVEIRLLTLETVTTTDLTGQFVISLLEVDAATIYAWTEAEFQSFYKVVSTASHLFWVTKGSLLESWKAGVEFAPAQGLLRVLRNEYPLASFPHLDLSAAFDLESASGAKLVVDIWQASLQDESETEFAELKGEVYIPRAVDAAGLDEDLQLASGVVKPQRRLLGDAPSSLRLACSLQNGDHLWVNDEDFLAGDGIEADEVEIEVRFVGLNGLLLSAATLQDKVLASQAFDAVGAVSRVGTSVNSFTVGQYVIMHNQSGACRSRLRQHSSLVAALPTSLKPEEAAGAASAFMAAHYALSRIAQVQKGHVVLIHDAASVFGQAAIQVAQSAQATVYALVGSVIEKRSLMEQYSLQASSIFDSSQKYFAAAIEQEAIKGVNVILASQNGPAVALSLELLADSGCFIDLTAGQEAATSATLSLPRSKSCASLIRVNLGRVWSDNPAIVQRLFQETFSASIAPILPVVMSSVGSTKQEIDELYSNQHGSTVLSISDNDAVLMLPPASEPFSLDPLGTYVLAGGLGALGLNIAHMMADHGAKHLVFLSRSAGSKNEPDLEKFRAKGVKADAYRCDVNDAANVASVFGKLLENGYVVKGLIQCAMVLEDAIFENMTHEKWTRAFTPKSRGSRNLLAQLRPNDDPFFILLSSITGVIGNTAQANYASGNTFEDALAQHAREHLGIRATSIDVGLVADSSHFTAAGGFGELKNYLNRYQHRWVGLRCTLDELCTALQSIMRSTTSDGSILPPQVILGLGDTFSRAFGGTGFQRDGKFNLRLIKDDGNGDGSGAERVENVEEKLRAATSLTEAAEAVEHALKLQVAAAFGIEVEEVDVQRPLPELGVDSLKAVELRNKVSKEMQSDISVFELLSATPLAEVAVKIASRSALVQVEAPKA
ncbi:Beta-ketoacyl synthase [Cordyceps militaris]|uniref:Beta-ketoacyl synthase n=1 Tax=Cordyceps militaris TaxID=73501 RepID=A0A2H4SQF1_CORMI|nr:Beta-ketoacyl synthase [Cordyceps militaris]